MGLPFAVTLLCIGYCWLPPIEAGESLLPTAETTDYGLPTGPGDFASAPAPGQEEQPEISADAVFANVQSAAPDAEEAENQEEADRVFAKLQEMSSSSSDAGSDDQPSDAGFDEVNKEA